MVNLFPPYNNQPINMSFFTFPINALTLLIPEYPLKDVGDRETEYELLLWG